MIVGIDLGTTNSVIAYIDENNIPQIIPNEEGDNLTPSIVFFEDDTPAVGTVAKNHIVADPMNTIQLIKRQMGNASYKFIDEKGDTYTPEEISAIILKKLRQDAEVFLGKPVREAVITVPACFNDSQRKSTQDAGQIAGLKILKIINEPTAAILAYSYKKNYSSQNIMVYHLGGGTFDVTIMSICNDNIIIRATGGDRNLGGFDFDNCIMQYVHEQFHKQHGIDLYNDLIAQQDLREKAETCKKELSSKEKTLINISSGGKSLKIEVTRDLFNDLISSLINHTIFIMKSVLNDANYRWNDIEKILLIGGSTRVRLVSKLIEKETGKKPSCEVNPDEVVAIGAAIQASIIYDREEQGEEASKKIKISDINSHSLGILAIDKNTRKKKNFIVLRRNTPVPVQENQIFYTVSDNSEYIEIEVTEGEGEEIEYVKVIGKALVKLPEKRPSGSPVKIVISYDENLIVHVSAIDKITGINLGEISIERKSNLTQDDIITKSSKISKLGIKSKIKENTLREKLNNSIDENLNKNKTNRNTKSLKEALDKLQALIGMLSVKREIEGIVKLIEYEKNRRSILDLPNNQTICYHFMFTGNPGTGKTTVARLIGDIFYHLGILEKGQLIEVDRSKLVGEYVGQTAILTQEAIKSAIGGVLFVDEAYSLARPEFANDFGREAIETLLKAMEDQRGQFTVILAGYTAEMRELIKMNPGLKSRINIEINFPNYTDNELLFIARDIAAKNYYTLSIAAEKAFLERINKENIDEHFANARTVRNILEESMREKALRMAGKSATRAELCLLEPIDFGIKDLHDKEEMLNKVIAELESMVGLREVKDKILEIKDYVMLEVKRKEAGLRTKPLVLHMQFLGNPGTGKTTVARIVSRIFKAMGVLKRGHMVEVTRTDLVGGYLGQTAIKTLSKIKEAYGGVLFIDEAYSLSQGSENDFGREAISTLIKEMEDSKDKLVVILAGYPNEMEKLLGMNPGLKDRIRFNVNFPDYTPDEMVLIFSKMCEKDDYIINQLEQEELLKVFNTLYQQHDRSFGNGRLVEKCFEVAKINQAKRINRDNISGNDLQLITLDDIKYIEALYH